jgi:hypothetical protein
MKDNVTQLFGDKDIGTEEDAANRANAELAEIEGIAEAGNAFEKAKNEARDWAKGKTLQELAIEQKAVKEVKEDMEAQLKLINARFDVLRFEAIPNKVEEMGLESPVKLEGIGRVSLTADIQCSTKGGMKEALFSWLRKNKCEAMIEENVNASTLKSFVRKRMLAGEPYPEDCVTVTPITKASILK